MEECYEHDGKHLVAENGRSAADSEHIVGEVMKCSKIPRAVEKGFSDCLVSIEAERGSFLAESLEGALTEIPL